MKIDINSVLATVKPWDLSLEIDGVDYPVRRLSSADFKRLSESSTKDEAENKEFIKAMFEGTPPDVGNWDPEKAAAVIGVVVAYYQNAVIRKNFDAAAKAVANQLPR